MHQPARTMAVGAVVTAALHALDGSGGNPLQVHVCRGKCIQLWLLVRGVVHQQLFHRLDLCQPTMRQQDGRHISQQVGTGAWQAGACAGDTSKAVFVSRDRMKRAVPWFPKGAHVSCASTENGTHLAAFSSADTICSAAPSRPLVSHFPCRSRLWSLDCMNSMSRPCHWLCARRSSVTGLAPLSDGCAASSAGCWSACIAIILSSVRNSSNNTFDSRVKSP